MKILNLKGAAGAVLPTVLLLTACATGAHQREERTAAVLEQITPQLERLYMDAKTLEEIYLDLRSVAKAYALRGDAKQLNYLQKAALYVQKAGLQVQHQYEILAVMKDIKPGALADYCTRRVRALRKVIDESGFDDTFLEIYGQAIEVAQVRADIDRARALIRSDRDILSHLLETIQPLANPPRRPRLTL